jgi:hypothetical protein
MIGDSMCKLNGSMQQPLTNSVLLARGGARRVCIEQFAKVVVCVAGMAGRIGIVSVGHPEIEGVGLEKNTVNV